MRLTWKKGGLRVTCEGVRNTRTGELRPLTQADVDQIRKDFEGKDQLEEPITILPFNS